MQTHFCSTFLLGPQISFPIGCQSFSKNNITQLNKSV